MFHLLARGVGLRIRPEHCTEEDYGRLFASCADQFHWLCCTLTGDEARAEASFQAALDQSLQGANLVFREWMVSWARRLVIKSCIVTMHTEIQNAARGYDPGRNYSRADLPNLPCQLSSQDLQRRLLELDILSRFVFVLRSLENYALRDTALLLDVDEQLCASAYLQASKTLRDSVLQKAGTDVLTASAGEVGSAHQSCNDDRHG